MEVIVLKQNIEDRTTCASGISIGTGLALETLFDVEIFDKARKRPKRIDPTDYPTHIYNIYTLYRNVLSSIKYKDKEILVSNKLVKEQLLNDMYLLIDLYNDTGIELIFYLPDYTLLHKKYIKGKDPTAYTPYVTHSFIAENIKRLVFPGVVCRGTTHSTLPRMPKKVLLLSHFTIDLLDAKNIPNLHLLESHTGKIKTKLEWGSKYHPIGKRDLSMLPMNSRLLYMFGDKSLVKPMPILDRRGLYELIMTQNWTPNTSNDRVNRVVKQFNTAIPV